MRAFHIVLTLLLGASQFTVTADAKSFRWSSQGDMRSTDPHASDEGLTSSPNHHVYERLIGHDKAMRPIPELALSWQQTAPTVWVFKLRPGVKFHDGLPFSADDVIFSVERAQSSISPFTGTARPIGKGRKIDALTVEFTTPGVNPVMVGLVGAIAIMNKSWCVKNKVEKAQNLAAKEQSFAARSANGTGPYTLVSREPDVKTVFRKNPNWWGLAEKRMEGNVDEFTYLPLQADATRTAALLSGEIDFVLDPPLQNLDQMKKNPALKVVEGKEDRVIFFLLDQARDELLYSNVKGKNPFKDKRVRQAMYQAIDVEAIRTKVMRGLATPAANILSNPTGAGVPAAMQVRRPFDLAAAKKLMAEAGYAIGFEVRLDCPNNRYINDEKICVAVASMLAQIGIKVEVNAMPRSIWSPKGTNRDTSFIMLGWGGRTGDPDAFHSMMPLWHSADDRGNGQSNWGGVKDAKLDALLDAQAAEANPVKRQQLILDAVKLHDDNIYHLPLHFQSTPWASRANVSFSHNADNTLYIPWGTIK
ncbi:MAG: ABC transporter substrate-binding protein [Aeromicrobium sp.]|nr:ABC transporter substrate-binding protein [Burkholderiales bacterium]